jgi:hypothetical protein
MEGSTTGSKDDNERDQRGAGMSFPVPHRYHVANAHFVVLLDVVISYEYFGTIKAECVRV